MFVNIWYKWQCRLKRQWNPIRAPWLDMFVARTYCAPFCWLLSLVDTGSQLKMICIDIGCAFNCGSKSCRWLCWRLVWWRGSTRRFASICLLPVNSHCFVLLSLLINPLRIMTTRTADDCCIPFTAEVIPEFLCSFFRARRQLPPYAAASSKWLSDRHRVVACFA